MRTSKALSVVACVCAVALLAGCRQATGVAPTPLVTVAPSPVATAAEEVDLVLGELTEALHTARGLRDALRDASRDASWERVTQVCRAYPLGPVDAAFGVRLTQGLRSKSNLQGWWPEQVAAVDAAAATTCFVTGSAAGIPPGSKVEPGGLTTAEIAAQPLQAALDELRDSSSAALRALVEAHRQPRT